MSIVFLYTSGSRLAGVEVDEMLARTYIMMFFYNSVPFIMVFLYNGCFSDMDHCAHLYNDVLL
jgi:hypothetical protein